MSKNIAAPSDFDASMKKIWRELQAALKDQGTWKDTDKYTLEALVRSLNDAKKCRLEWEKEPWIGGSTGQKKRNPAKDEERNARLDAHRYAEALLLTAQMRQRHKLLSDAPDEDPMGDLFD